MASAKGKKLSPAMAQYQRFKQQHPDYVLFFRMGDFYEMFHDDAKLAHEVMGVTLTARSGVPMAGVPHHSVEGYLRKMIAAGHRVAMCEQVQDPKEAKGVVERDVTRLVTPGTLTDDGLMEGAAENLLAVVAEHTGKASGHQWALAWADLSTGQVGCVQGAEAAVRDEAARLTAAELLVPELSSGEEHPAAERFRMAGVKTVVARPGWQFAPHHAAEQLQKHYGVSTAGGFGFADDDAAVVALGALLAYLEETQKTALTHLRTPRRHDPSAYLLIDADSFRSLEIDRTVRGGSAAGSLLHAIDRTRSPMGKRLLRQWLRTPLADVEPIVQRQRAIAALLDHPTQLDTLGDLLAGVCDIERIVTRVTVNRVGPRDLASLRDCLRQVPMIAAELEPIGVGDALCEHVEFAKDQAAKLKAAILEEPAPHLREGGVIAKGFDADLDELRTIGRDAKTWLADYQQRLSQTNDIGSLKVGYNRVFGYYIEVTNAHKDKVDPSWVRKQTLKDCERYITDELKQFEDKALGAKDRSIALEAQLFEKVRRDLLPSVRQFQAVAAALAELDVLAALAKLARERRYCRPTITDERVLHIEDGKHPVLEQQLAGEFVANDLAMAAGDCLGLITGPNMAGKSTYIRQVALIVLLAQIGSNVPAKSATVGVADRLFTRIGASDEIHAGQSTFMVEMTETANLLNNATDRSVIILDEIG
ncbi:MAG: DNA mismatch repair protein MutS, partial [Planctomycetota bacterium]